MGRLRQGIKTGKFWVGHGAPISGPEKLRKGEKVKN